jgi:uncharacterized glyoxalase superfamily protein PhnB
MSRSLAFWRDMLGFEVSYAFPSPEQPAFLTLEVEGGTVALAAASGPVAPGSSAVWVYADDVDDLVVSLRRGGVEIAAEPGDRDWGERVASVRDPDGHLVHLGTPGGD